MRNQETRLSSIEFFDSVIKALVDLEKKHNWDLGMEEEVEVPVLPPVLPVDQDAPVDPEQPVIPLELPPKVK